MKAIPTKYKGYTFRSRLEARWAVFFDAAELTYRYEPEAFEHQSVRYLPDFELQSEVGGSLWLEIKPMQPDQSAVTKFSVFSAGLPTPAKARLIVGEPFINQFAVFAVSSGGELLPCPEVFRLCPSCEKVDLALVRRDNELAVSDCHRCGSVTAAADVFTDAEHLTDAFRIARTFLLNPADVFRRVKEVAARIHPDAGVSEEDLVRLALEGLERGAISKRRLRRYADSIVSAAAARHADDEE